MESIKQLRKICQRSAERESITYRISRFFSIYFTWFFLHFKRITPNRLTVSSSVFFVLFTFCYIKGEYWLNLIGIFLLLLANLLDFVDGEIARYRGQVTPISGHFLEPMTHDLKYAFLFIPLTLGIYSSFPYPTLLIFLGFSASMFQVLFRLAKLRYIHIILPRQSEKTYRKIGEKAFYSNKKLKRISGYFGGTTSIITWLLLATILDKVYLVVIFYGILSPMIYLLLLFKQYKGIKALKYE